MLQAGQEPIQGYVLRHPLGAGAFAEVWAARDPAGRPVALKFMDCRSKSSAMIASEIRVLRGLRELRHPHIIELLGVFASSHYIILSMERADGNLEDLRQAYRDETGMNIPPDHLLEMLDQVASALDFLAEVQLPEVNPSSHGLQHCDVKPTNLLLVGEQVKVADFGLCAGTSWTTHRNAWRGTPPYAAPELFRGQATRGTDQFALAITYLKLCAGDRVFWPSDPLAKPSTLPVDMTKVREREVSVIARALHPEPLARWPSCRDFLAALRAALQAPRRVPTSLRKKLRPADQSGSLPAPPHAPTTRTT
jgi:serine/threonine-protein kinase